VTVGWLFVLGCSHGDTATASPSPSPSPSPPAQLPSPAIDAAVALDATPGSDAATAGTCLAKTGCRAVPSLPACPPGLVTKTLAEVVTSGDEFLGKEIAVRGPLRHTKPTCTHTACQHGQCCNRCSAKLVLSEHDGVSAFKGAVDAILVDNIGDLDRYTCKGDDSTVCCVVRASGNEVVARGTLGTAGVAAQSDTWSMSGTTLCAP